MDDKDYDTVRDVMTYRIRGLLSEYFKVSIKEVDEKLVEEIGIEAFSVCGINEKEQDEEW